MSEPKVSRAAADWLGLQATHNSHRWILPVTTQVATGHGFLFGGCGLGAAIAALEGTSGRPLAWATAQYLSYAKTGTMLDIDVTIAVEGRATTQARATAHVGGTEILTVNAALGTRSFGIDENFLQPPAVKPPEECPAREPWSSAASFHRRLEDRWAHPPGHDGDGPALLAPGRTAVWMRVPDLAENSAAALAVLGDFVPMGMGVASGGRTSANSLDNTLRVIELRPSEWFLLDIQVDGVRRGFGHGYLHIWSDDGTLLAVASQSAIVRESTPDRLPPKRFSEAPEG